MKRKGRGRPRGADLTCIGLPKKSSRVISFTGKSCREKQKAMLYWLFGRDGTRDIGVLEFAPPQFRDPQVITSLHLLKDLVCLEALQDLMSKSFSTRWSCAKCSETLQEVRSLACDSCLLWFHFSCAGVKRVPHKKEWFCRDCRKTQN